MFVWIIPSQYFTNFGDAVFLYTHIQRKSSEITCALAIVTGPLNEILKLQECIITPLYSQKCIFLIYFILK